MLVSNFLGSWARVNAGGEISRSVVLFLHVCELQTVIRGSSHSSSMSVLHMLWWCNGQSRQGRSVALY